MIDPAVLRNEPGRLRESQRRRGESVAIIDELVAAHDARQLEEAAALASMRGRISAFTQEAHEAAAAVRAGERAALEAWENQVQVLRTRLEEALAEVEELDRKALDTAREKLAALTKEAEDVDARLIQRDLLDNGLQRGRQFAEQVFGQNFGRLVDILREGQLRGELRQDIDPALAALMVIGTNLTFFQAREVFRHFPDVNFAGSPETYSRMAMDIVLRGIQPNGSRNAEKE